jgi:hypothetical protein
VAQQIGSHEKQVWFGGEVGPEGDQRRIEAVVLERRYADMMTDKQEMCHAIRDILHQQV